MKKLRRNVKNFGRRTFRHNRSSCLDITSNDRRNRRKILKKDTIRVRYTFQVKMLPKIDSLIQDALITLTWLKMFRKHFARSFVQNTVILFFSNKSKRKTVRTSGLLVRRTCLSTSRGCRFSPAASPCTPWSAVSGTIWRTAPSPCRWTWSRSAAEPVSFRYGIAKIPSLNSQEKIKKKKINKHFRKYRANTSFEKS